MKMLKLMLEKEFKQLKRNSFVPKMCIMMPLMVVLILPLVTTMDVKHMNIAVVDKDGTSLSKRLASQVDDSTYFSIVDQSADFNRTFSKMEAGDVDLIMEIPADFEKSFINSTPKTISLSANGTNATKGGIGQRYLAGTLGTILKQVRTEKGLPMPKETITATYHYNPTLNYKYLMIPALMTLIVVMLCGFLPALNVVGEKEKGTIEQINVTPISKFTFTLGKLIPYWVVGTLSLTISIVTAWLVYGFSPQGNLLCIYLAAFMFMMAMSEIGLSIANCSDTMQQTMFVMFFFVMVFVLMSGTITPIASMPKWAEYITYAEPPRYFVEAMRAVYLKGATFADLALTDYLPLLGLDIILGLTAAFTYKKRN